MCGKDPTVILGGVQAGKESNLRLGESNIVAVELDESDGSFLEPDVELAVITNIEPDHLDYYRTEEAVVEAFEKFAASASEKTGIVACVDDERTKEFGLNYNGDFLCVGTKGFPRLLAHDIKVDGFAQKFSLDFDGKSLGEFCLNLPGEHNIKNALCAMAAAFKFGCPWEELQKVLPMCKGVARRFDIIGEVDGVVAVDDYAHHPTEISACISAARSVHNGRLIAVFQPHLYSRTKFLCDEFADALCIADEVVLVDVYAAREEPEAGVGSSVLAEKIKEKGRAVYGPFGRDKTAGEVKGMVASGDMVLFIGAGDVGKCAYEFVG
jgi:UDP-N-acetylmuramate--alanine ligase